MNPFEIIQKLIDARGIELSPPNPIQIKWEDLGILDKEVENIINIIDKHVQCNNNIAIYGDYDVDGISATAILWQTLYAKYKNVFPHIPDRRNEGYGLSKMGIDHCVAHGAKLIITLDSGIVAFDAIEYAKTLGLEIIVIDHHEKMPTLPKADGILHSTATCAAGLAYFLARELGNEKNLDLACLAVICDLVPLTGINRSIAKYGLEELNNTTRSGILALKDVAGIKEKINAYSVGFLLGPRLNAAGRLTHALDSLRLLCTNNKDKALELAKYLNEVNGKRQQLTEDLGKQALDQIGNSDLIVVADKNFDEGVIGLIAAKLVEKKYRPAIAISVGENISKASARSVAGFDITECLRGFEKMFLSVGGHAMAAGFSFPTDKLDLVKNTLTSVTINEELLIKKERYDLKLGFEDITWDLYIELQKLQPFGLGNPTPVFLTNNVEILEVKVIGKMENHLKLVLRQNEMIMNGVWFNVTNNGLPKFVNVYYQIDADSYRGLGNIQLVVKSLHG